MEKQRDSKIELLRLILVFVIVFYHLVMHSFGESAMAGSFSWQFTTNILHFSVPCFLLISGYYGIKPKRKGLFGFVFLTFFYSLFLYIVFSSLKQVPFSLGGIWRALTPFGHDTWWFITMYVVLYVLTPFINIIIENFKNEQVLLFTIIIAIIDLYFGWLWHSETIHAGRDIFNFVLLYMIGYWLRDIPKHNIKYNLFGIVLISSIIGICYFIGGYIPIVKIIIRIIFFPYCSPGLILLSVLIVDLFINLNSFYSKTVNFAAQSVFPIYLLSENYLTKPYIEKLYELSSSFDFISILGILFALSIAVFVGCMIIDMLVSPFYRRLSSYLFSKLSKIRY